MPNKKTCKGTVYKIYGKKYCVGEKIKKNKKGTKLRLRISKKMKKSKKTRKSKKGGTNYDKVNCCMCGKEVDIKDTLIPQACLIKNGAKAHRICQECWWDPESGFAREGISHDCPGCVKNLPLTQVAPKSTVIVDLTEDKDD